ncbi:hypothetical protein ACFLZW_00165 [Chloroflexota bacterium]
MTKIFQDQEVHRFLDRNSGRVYSDLEFHNCRFIGSAISVTRKPMRRSTVRNVRLVDCEVTGCSVNTAIIENVVVDGLKTHTLLQTWGAVYNRVVLKGDIGRIMISSVVATGLAKPKQQQAFDKANASYYQTVGWALDISEARFDECDIRGLPSDLIVRDPETQVIIRREKALEGKWRHLDLSKTYWKGWIELFLSSGEPDVILVAPKLSPKFNDWLDGLKLLRDAGVAEPD